MSEIPAPQPEQLRRGCMKKVGKIKASARLLVAISRFLWYTDDTGLTQEAGYAGSLLA